MKDFLWCHAHLIFRSSQKIRVVSFGFFWRGRVERNEIYIYKYFLWVDWNQECPKFYYFYATEWRRIFKCFPVKLSVLFLWSKRNFMMQMESSKYLHILLAQIIASILTQNDNDKDFHFLFKLLPNFSVPNITSCQNFSQNQYIKIENNHQGLLSWYVIGVKSLF